MLHIAAKPGTARAALGSDVVLANGWGFASGLLPIDLDDDRMPLPEGIERQTKKIFANLDRLLAAAGVARDHVVLVRVSIVELPRLYERMNSAYAGFFAPDRLPSRSVVGVSHLPRGAQIMMDFVLHAAAP